MEEMSIQHTQPRIGYVLKMYPRYSETFIVTEILAHEAAGLNVEIFSLRPPVDTHFQDSISRVRSPVNYIESNTPHVTAYWSCIHSAAREIPGFWSRLAELTAEDSREVFQAVLLASMVRKKGITHLHAHFASLATSIARMAAKLAGISYSFTAHAKDIFHDDVRDVDFRRKLHDCLYAITVSDYNVQYLRERYGRAAAKVRRLYNGLDLARFPFSAAANRDIDVVAVGRLVEKKGFDDLVTACSILRDRGRNVTCRIIGSGPLEGELRARMRSLSLGKNVVAVGPRPQSVVLETIKRARILVAPCIEGSDGNRDGLPTVLLEAMALGTPCIATPVSGIPEAVIDGTTGLLVRPAEPVALADSIARLLDDDTLRAGIARLARKHVEAEFDIRRNSAQLREIFSAARMTATEAA